MREQSGGPQDRQKRRRPEDKTSRVYGQQNVRQAEPRAGRAQKRGPSFRRASADICLFALGLSAALALVPGPVAGTTAAGTALAGFSLAGGGSGLLPGRLHSVATRYVSARAQSRELSILEPVLTEEEANVLRRGKNASKATVAKHATPQEYRASTEYVTDPANLDAAAELIGEQDIVTAEVAKQALPYCNIVCLTGEEMKTAAEGFLNILYTADPSSVGGALPAEDFYYLGE